MIPTFSRSARALALGVALVAGTAACAQDAPSPPPGERLFEEPPPFILTSAPEAMAELEAYAVGGEEPLWASRLLQSVAVTGDSVAYFARVEAVARTLASSPDFYRHNNVSYAMEALRSLGAGRPYFRALVFDAARNIGLADAAFGILAQDPRPDELPDMVALDRTLPPPDPDASDPLSGPRSGWVHPPAEAHYGHDYRIALINQARRDSTYDAFPDGTQSRMAVIFGTMVRDTRAGGASREVAVLVRELYLRDPAGVEAYINGMTIRPVSDFERTRSPGATEESIRRYWFAVARAPATLVPPRRLDGPLAPGCLGVAATVWVDRDAARTVRGGPLAGTPFAGRLVGTTGPDVIVGTDTADAILGLAGDDTLCGLAGDDALSAGDGADTADGGPGTDGCDAAETPTACEGAIPALTDVRPVLECVAPAPGGGFTAYFGYENKTTRAGRVPYGSNNRITPAAFDRAQPDLFGLPSVVTGRPGRSPFYPGHAFTVTFAAGQTVVWKLFTRTSTASSGSARCPAP